MSKSSLIATLVIALALGSPAHARLRRRRDERMPTTSVTSLGDFSHTTSSSSLSQAKCDATVSAQTSSEAESALVDVYAELFRGYCKGFDKVNVDRLDAKIKAVASLVLESKLKCETSGKYAYACGGTWAGARSFAGAAFEAYAAALAVVEDTEECSCDLSLTADASVSVSAFGDIWTEIYSSLDDFACASTAEYDEKPTGVEQSKKVECTAKLIYSIWAKATAGAWVRGSCHNDNPLVCRQCCVTPAGDYMPDCDCEDWTKQCEEHVVNWAKTVATARIEGDVTADTASCTGTVKDDLVADSEEMYIPTFSYRNTANDDCATVQGNCMALARSEVSLSAISAQAVASMELTKNLCASDYNSAEQVYEDAGKIARAMVEVYSKATGSCSISAGDGCLNPYYDGGCAYAKVWVEGFSQACAEAFAKADAVIKFGTQADADCQCNLDGKAYAEALAREVETIHAKVAQTVEAEACVDGAGSADSVIARKCVASSTAMLYAKAVAQILVSNNCVAPKADYCKGKCREVSVESDWRVCIDECQQSADAEATAVAGAIASIDLENVESCQLKAFEGVYGFDAVTQTTAPLNK